VNFILGCVVRGTAVRLAKAPEFFLLFLHARILYAYSGLLKYNMYDVYVYMYLLPL